jgi:CubicO group peptidase (beta-lactamase class C family)
MAASEDDLRAALEQRFKGDRSGACIAAAVIENGTTARAYFCANAKFERSIDERTAFEIGSITKTMTVALLAEIIGRGEIAIDDPLAKLLPPGTNVPSFNGTHITVGNIVTHTSGLPSFPWRITGIDSLRFHPRCYYRPEADAPTEIWPAMIAAVTDLQGRITGAHRTWLDPSGRDKAPVDTPRRAMG